MRNATVSISVNHAERYQKHIHTCVFLMLSHNYFYPILLQVHRAHGDAGAAPKLLEFFPFPGGNLVVMELLGPEYQCANVDGEGRPSPQRFKEIGEAALLIVERMAQLKPDYRKSPGRWACKNHFDAVL